MLVINAEEKNKPGKDDKKCQVGNRDEGCDFS